MDRDDLRELEGLRVDWPGGLLEVRIARACDSTQLEARRRADRGEPPGLVLVADAQTAGVGRRGRSWLSPAGVNLYLTLDLDTCLPPEELHRPVFIAGLALHDTVGEMVRGNRHWLKWPNDLWWDDAKLAGILARGLPTGGPPAGVNRGTRVLLGVGVNLNATAEQLPPGATSLLLATGEPVRRTDFLRRLLESLSRRFRRHEVGPWDDLAFQWKRSARLRRWASLEILGSGDGPYRPVGLGRQGELIVTGPGGERRSLRSEDVSVRIGTAASSRSGAG